MLMCRIKSVLFSPKNQLLGTRLVKIFTAAIFEILFECLIPFQVACFSGGL